MAQDTKALPGALYARAEQFAGELDAGQTAAADQMLAAWAQSYGRTRIEIDGLLAKIEQAKATGQPMSPAWLYQRERLKSVLDTSKVEMARYAEFASATAKAQQQSAVLAALKHSEKLAKTTMAETGAGLAETFVQVNPRNLQHLAGFLADGSPLDELTQQFPAQTTEALRSALVQGVALGKGSDWMRRKATEALGIARHRAETIMRTEALRAYRYTTRETYLANAHVLGGWVWVASLDARCCAACVLMDGTEHPLDSILDGHPRCRCRMVPRTKTWEELGASPDLPDTRPPIRSGRDWFTKQSPAVQRGILGRRKYQAWLDGQISLDDVVARPQNDRWGTMRRERSLVEIKEGRNPNWLDTVAQPKTPPKPTVLTPQPHMVQAYADAYDLDEIEMYLANAEPGSQMHVNLQAAIQVRLNQMEYGPALPKVDGDKVAKAVEKLNQAALTKGYPSKGYSQTKAVYKAHAGGTVGKPVGPLKALTLEQKLTAQAILDQHNAELPKVLRGVESDAKVKAASVAAEQEAREIIDQFDGDNWNQPHAALKDALDTKRVTLADDLNSEVLQQKIDGKALDKIKASTAYKTRVAAIQAHDAVVEQYEDARQGVLALRDDAKVWEPTPDSDFTGTITIHEDGWGTWTDLDGSSSPQVLTPIQISKMLDPDHFQPQAIQADPAHAKALVDDLLTDDNGYLDADGVNALEDWLTDPTVSAQVKADTAQALALAQATLLPVPQPQIVAKYLDQMLDGSLMPVTVKELAENAVAGAPGQAQMKSNLKAALDQYEAQVKVVQANPDQVAYMLAAIDNGSLTLKDLTDAIDTGTVAGQARVDIQAAIDKIKAKALGTAPNPALVRQYVADLEDGQLDLEGLKANLGNLPPVKQAAAKAAIAKVSAGKAAPTVGKAASAPPFDPARLQAQPGTLGTHGAKVMLDPDTGERWLWKAQDDFLSEVDQATAALQVRAGLKAPDTYVLTITGKRGSIQRMFDAKPAFPGQFTPRLLNEQALGAIQREHVLDWLIANHDGHVQQWLTLSDGTVAAIDKGQAFRWFGQDRLDWDFHPNASYGAPPPVYNALWRAFAEGDAVEIDMTTVRDQVARLQAIPEDELRAMFRPYAEAAAREGRLAVAQPSYPGVVKGATLPTNDVDAFLDALVARQRALGDDFDALYDRAAKARAKALPGWKPPKGAKAKPTRKVAKTKAGWVGKDKPQPPKAPEAPEAQAAVVFDSWLDKAKARYDASPAKKSASATLESSNNWARFRRVIDDGDRSAVQELFDRQYLDEALRDEALALIDQAERVKAQAAAAYEAERKAYDKAMAAWRKDVADWRDANGITGPPISGMDAGVKRHGTNAAGEKWAGGHFSKDRYTAKQRETLRSYTGSAYRDWNKHLRDTQGKPRQYGPTYQALDAAMDAQPIPEDVILHRGIGATHGSSDHPFDLKGRRLGYTDDLQQLVGSVQVDHGYMSTSVGKDAGFSSEPIQLVIRAPAGTPASYVQTFSQYSSEREIVVGRGVPFVIHAAYRTGKSYGPQWVLEVELLPDLRFTDPSEWADLDLTPMPSAKPWSK